MSACPTAFSSIVLVFLLPACHATAPGSDPPILAVEIPPVSASTPLDLDSEESDAELEASFARYRGTWEGRGVQNDGQNWEIVVEVFGPGDKPCATVEYPPHGGSSISCGGEWHCELPPSTPARLVGVERILEGRGRCIDGCQVDFDLRRGVAAFDCARAGVTGEAELERVK